MVEKLIKFYKFNLYTEEMVRAFLENGMITEEDYNRVISSKE